MCECCNATCCQVENIAKTISKNCYFMGLKILWEAYVGIAPTFLCMWMNLIHEKYVTLTKYDDTL